MKQEIEARFLEVNKDAMVNEILSLGATDKGEYLLSEVIFYDKENKWPDEGRFVRIRSCDGKTRLTYKHNKAQTIDSAREIEFDVPDAQLAEQFLEAIGLMPFRHQEKKRHTFLLDGATIDFDTWPKVPTYVEIEGISEANIKSVAEKIGLNWEDAIFDDARAIIQGRYDIAMSDLNWFTFDRVE